MEDEKNGGGEDTLESNTEETFEGQIAWTDVRCEPVIDFLHAQVYTDNPDIYGYIKIVDLQGSKNFPAYDRHQSENPQRLYPPGNYLQLSGPEEIPTLNKPIVVVGINNVDTGHVIAHAQQPLLKSTQYPSSTSDDAFEKLSTLIFQDNALLGGTSGGGRVELQCVAFTFGVYAQVRVFLYNDSAPQSQKIDHDDDDQSGVEVFGFISAKCNPMLMAKDNYENHLFNVPKEECEWIGFGGEIVLSKSLVAVPAYSQIEISLDLKGFEDDEFIIVQGSVCFEPSNYYAGRKEVGGVNGYKVEVDVRWKYPSLLNKHWCKEDVIPAFQAVPHCPGVYASNLLEVFSLFIARPNSEEVNMYGTVDIYCNYGWCNIFNREKHEAYFLSRGCNLLPMKGPGRAVAPGTRLLISFDLRDVDGHVKIIGTAQSCVGIDERQRPWFDRQLCSVVKIKKEKSFVAVHYILFSSALLAGVTVCLVWKRRSSSRVNIYGDIFASYDDKVVSYSTTYNKKFFKRVLFSRKKANSEEVFFTGKEAHSEEKNLILSTNLVAVPMTSSLLVELNLSFQTAESTHQVAEHVKFQLRDLGKVISSDEVDICIGVTWKDVP